MTATESPATWNCRAGLLFSRLFSFGLALLIALLGILAHFGGGSMIWIPVAVIAAIGVGFKGAPFLLRLLERRGVFGRVRLEGDRLSVGKASRQVDLSRPFDLEARYQRAQTEREHDLRGFGPGMGSRSRSLKAVKSVLDITVLTATLEQDGRKFHLVGDRLNGHPGPDYDVEEIQARRVAIGPPPVRPVRLRGADLAALLRDLQARPSCKPATSPLPEKPLVDPRRAFCPHRKVVAGAAVLLALFCAGAYLAFAAAEERHHEEYLAGKAALEKEKKARAIRCAELMGKQVSIEARRGVRIVGRVTGGKVKEETAFDTELRKVVVARLTVEVDHLEDGDGKRLPDDAEIPFRHDEDIVRKGSILEVRLEEVREL